LASPGPLGSRRCSLEQENQIRASTGCEIIAGVDEAGRGPLAGPVVAVAVILPGDFILTGLNDSKKLTARKRQELYLSLTNDNRVRCAVGIIEVEEIDRLNILRATHEAMRQAVLALPQKPDHVLIDGLPVHPFPIPQTALVGGDASSMSIAAASVIAKVTRDEIMEELDQQFPLYGFSSHKGYGTAQHLKNLHQHGPCPAHRKSFSPVAQALLPFST